MDAPGRPKSTYSYNRNGNLTASTSPAGTVSYEYSPASRLARVAFEDGTGVRYSYDGLGRKVLREETYWQPKGPSEQGLAHGRGFQQGKRIGTATAPGLQRAQLRTESTACLYEGLRVFKEYTGNGSPLAEYQVGNGQVISRQMFGLHGTNPISRRR